MDEATLTAIRERDAACVSLDDPPRSEAAYSDGWWQSAADRRLLLAAYDRLRAIEAAARAMFAEEYGVCVECGLVGEHPLGDSCLTLALRSALEVPSDAR